MQQKVLFEKMTGKWEGSCRTWFEPGKLADESKVTGEITTITVSEGISVKSCSCFVPKKPNWFDC